METMTPEAKQFLDTLSGSFPEAVSPLSGEHDAHTASPPTAGEDFDRQEADAEAEDAGEIPSLAERFDHIKRQRFYFRLMFIFCYLST